MVDQQRKKFKITLDKRNLDQKINGSKPDIWKLLISDFKVESLKPDKN